MKKTLYYYARSFNGRVREGVFIRLKSSEGKVGWGEVAPLPGFSRETLEEAIKDLVEGNDSSFPSVKWGYAAAMLDLLSPLSIPSVPIRILEKEKIKVGHLNLEEAIKKVKTSGCSGVDMNQKWTLEQGLALAKECPHLDYFEEPLKPGEDASAFFHPVALDESLLQEKMPPYPQVKIHVIKPMLYGYPLPPKTKGVDFILSSSYESELGLYQIAQLAHRLSLPLKPMGLGTAHLFESPLFEEGTYYKNGHLHFPKKWRLKMDQVQVIFDDN